MKKKKTGKKKTSTAEKKTKLWLVTWRILGTSVTMSRVVKNEKDMKQLLTLLKHDNCQDITVKKQ